MYTEDYTVYITVCRVTKWENGLLNELGECPLSEYTLVLIWRSHPHNKTVFSSKSFPVWNAYILQVLLISAFVPFVPLVPCFLFVTLVQSLVPLKSYKDEIWRNDIRCFLATFWKWRLFLRICLFPLRF